MTPRPQTEKLDYKRVFRELKFLMHLNHDDSEVCWDLHFEKKNAMIFDVFLRLFNFTMFSHRNELWRILKHCKIFFQTTRWSMKSFLLQIFGDEFRWWNTETKNRWDEKNRTTIHRKFNSTHHEFNSSGSQSKRKQNFSSSKSYEFSTWSLVYSFSKNYSSSKICLHLEIISSSTCSSLSIFSGSQTGKYWNFERRWRCCKISNHSSWFQSNFLC